MARPLSVSMRKLLRRIRPAASIELMTVPDVTGTKGRSQSIPRVVYQTTESRDVHPTHFKAIQEFRALNDDLDFIVFDRDARDSYMKNHWGEHPIYDVYKRALFGQMKADIFRYCVIYDNGGYYVDFNKGINTRITQLHPQNSTGLISYESNPELVFPPVEIARQIQNPFNLVIQWAFGFSRQHPFLLKLVNKIVEIEPFFRDKNFKYPKKALLTMSAPGVFTLVFREYVQAHGLDRINEAGEDFHGHGIFRLRGSKLLWKEGEHYNSHRNMPLISSP